MTSPGRPIRICIDRCERAERAADVLPRLLDLAGLWDGAPLRGLRVVVKPNLLRDVPLACTEPAVVAAACAWLLDAGAAVRVAESPGFGTCAHVARAVGLTDALAPLGLRVEAMGPGVPVRLSSGDEVRLSRTALEADAILSVARVKAHSQVRLTLSCKNLYGCVPGLRKAVHHAVQGTDPARFAAMQAAILGALPPVSGVADGIVAMHVTGPASGRPYPMGLLAASSSPVALDEAFCRVLGREPSEMLVQRAFELAGHPDCGVFGREREYPLLSPEDVRCEGFELPRTLLHTSFRPLRLLRSCLVRLREQWLR